jgi:hypothetical protein
MKLLIISQPYCGATTLGESLAVDLNHKFLQNPLDHEFPKKGAVYTEDQVKTEYDYPRGFHPMNGDDPWQNSHTGYNFPDDVAFNTIITHFVNWHKLPNSYSEIDFLNVWMPKFDHVLIVKAGDIEFNWKSHCAALAQPHEKNFWWKKHLFESQVFDYEDSHFDQTIKDKHETANNFLTNFIIDNPSIASTTIDELYGLFDEKKLEDLFKSWNFGWNTVDEKGANWGTIWHHVCCALKAEFKRW